MGQNPLLLHQSSPWDAPIKFKTLHFTRFWTQKKTPKPQDQVIFLQLVYANSWVFIPYLKKMEHLHG